MKLSPEEYLLILSNRQNLTLTPEEKKLIVDQRLSKTESWSMYLDYIKQIEDPVAQKIYKFGISLKVGDISFDLFKQKVTAYDTSKNKELTYMINQIINLYK